MGNKSKLKATLLATVVAANGAEGANPQYPSTQEPQGTTQAIDAPAKEATLTGKELFDILKSIEVFKTIIAKNPKLATEMAESFYKQITPKGTNNIDDTLTLSNTALETTLLDMGFNNEDIVPAMAHFNKIATKQNMQVRQEPMIQAPTAGENCLRGVINADGYPLSFTIDSNGDCAIDGKTSGNIDYLMPQGIKRGSLKESSMRLFLQGTKLQHEVYKHIKEKNVKSPYAQKFCKKHEVIIKKYGLEMDKNGNLRQTNPRYDEETIQRILQNNARYAKTN